MKYPIGTTFVDDARPGYVWTVTAFEPHRGYDYFLAINGVDTGSHFDSVSEAELMEAVEKNHARVDLTGMTNDLVSDYLKSG